MAFNKVNSRSIRLFAATPEEIEKKRPNLNAPYFRVNRKALEDLLSMSQGDVIMSIGVWKRKGIDGKPDYFTAEITYPDKEGQQKYLAKDDEWLAKNPRSEKDNERRRQYAMNKRSEERIGVSDAEEPPF